MAIGFKKASISQGCIFGDNVIGGHYLLKVAKECYLGQHSAGQIRQSAQVMESRRSKRCHLTLFLNNENVKKEETQKREQSESYSSSLQNAVQAIKLPDTFGLRKSEMDEHERRSRDRFFWRRYKLMNNLILWKDYIQEDFVRPLVINNLILEIVPSEWFSPSTLEKIARRAVGI
ncbi:30272_t:CDS:2 [Gigaspora margarita]|uniref:30272_t:CDS:1 n=1 Tax=Gigaspora margarita TaxID=4874 RepID=A0ABN7UU06_GIGMA|nr:30272_t:CDS:2 [Gigaspora margarita]